MIVVLYIIFRLMFFPNAARLSSMDRWQLKISNKTFLLICKLTSRFCSEYLVDGIANTDDVTRRKLRAYVTWN